jgi:uncharacterized protein related to proFAR isomerase
MPAPRTALIPVIDLMRGQVVRGRRGERQAYRPIVSSLCRGSEPLTVARALCEYSAASCLYLADLDALMGGPLQHEVLLRLLRGLPRAVELWLDGGFVDGDAAHSLLRSLQQQSGDADSARLVPVFGSESLRSREAMARAFARFPQAVLSLDCRGTQRLDAAGCWHAPGLWPQRVIVMTLERVGAADGPDLQTLRELRALRPQATLIGAGGLRSPADLAQAEQAGAAAWLVASALHDLTLR